MDDELATNQSEDAAVTCAGHGTVREWVLHHDERLSFAAAYVALAVSLSLFVSLFWLLVLVAIHLVLEWLKKRYRGYEGRGHAAIWTVWDVKLDLALALLAFVLAAYSGVTFGVAGAQSAGRAGILASRLGPITRGFAAARVVLFRLWFAARIIIIRKADMARAAAHGKLAEQQAAAEAGEDAAAKLAQSTANDGLGPIPGVPPWRTPWSRSDWAGVIFVLLNIVLLLAAPLITDQTVAGMLENFREQLHPWPQG